MQRLFFSRGEISAFVALCIFPRLINHTWARGIVFVVLLCVVVQGGHRYACNQVRLRNNGSIIIQRTVRQQPIIHSCCHPCILGKWRPQQKFLDVKRGEREEKEGGVSCMATMMVVACSINGESINTAGRI